MIIALFVFFGAVTGEAALPALQSAQDEVIAVLSEVNTQDGDSSGDNGENGNGDENGEDENGNEDENGDENGNGDGNGENGDGNEPEDNKVRTYNTAAGFVLPAMVAQIAVDNSPVLISCDDPEADCEDTSPGNSDQSQDGNDSGKNGDENGNGDGNNGDNGNIGLAIADQAKANRP